MARMYKLQFLLFVLTAFTATAQPPGADSTQWKLHFADEFNGTRLDRRKWNINYDWGQHPNDEVCICNCYTGNDVKGRKAYINFQNDTHNIKVSNGTVKLFTLKEKSIGEFWDWDEGYFRVTKKEVDYTTGLLFSKQRFYRGYIEMRFKLPPAPKFPKSYAGFGPSFWMYDGNCWSEIDGFELINGQNRILTSSVHYGIPPTMVGADTVCDIFGKRRVDYFTHTTIADDVWHTFGFDWGKDTIKYYLNGELYFTSHYQHIDSLKPMPIITGISSPPEGKCQGLDNMFNQWPYMYEIDYIRVWKRKED